MCTRRGVERTPRDLAIEAQTDRRFGDLWNRYGCLAAGTSFWQRNTASRKGDDKGGK